MQTGNDINYSKEIDQEVCRKQWHFLCVNQSLKSNLKKMPGMRCNATQGRCLVKCTKFHQDRNVGQHRVLQLVQFLNFQNHREHVYNNL